MAQNLWKFTGEQGQLEGLQLGEGLLSLKEGLEEGRFTSEAVTTEPFHHMVVSWNGLFPPGSAAIIEGRILQEGQWSPYITWAHYTGGEEKTTLAQEPLPGAQLLDDELILDPPARGFQVRAQLQRGQGGSPKFYQLAVTVKGDQGADCDFPDTSQLPKRVLLPAPAYAQNIRKPAIAMEICSPTTLAVLLNARDPSAPHLPESLAARTLDPRTAIYGNWAFTMAAAGSLGYEAHVQYGHLGLLLRELAQGRSVGISVAYTHDPEDAKRPYLSGAMDATDGHLLALIGYEFEGDGGPENLHFYAADSYAHSDGAAYRKYPWRQLERAWQNRAAYVITGRYAQVPSPLEEYQGKLRPGETPGTFQGPLPEGVELFYSEQTTQETPVNYEAPLITRANEKFHYDLQREGDKIQLPQWKAQGSYTLYLLEKDGQTKYKKL
ncbi:MAG: hypothetical protein Q4E76_02885 [Tissierellia bacterium]|nr:hypothetical protein [Tissierellia bacterium]